MKNDSGFSKSIRIIKSFTSFPRGNQVDGLPPASSVYHGESCANFSGGKLVDGLTAASSVSEPNMYMHTTMTNSQTSLLEMKGFQRLFGLLVWWRFGCVVSGCAVSADPSSPHASSSWGACAPLQSIADLCVCLLMCVPTIGFFDFSCGFPLFSTQCFLSCFFWTQILWDVWVLDRASPAVAQMPLACLNKQANANANTDHMDTRPARMHASRSLKTGRPWTKQEGLKLQGEGLNKRLRPNKNKVRPPKEKRKT